MSFTDKENNVIKEKLMDVQTPPVDAAWSRMSEMLEAAPVQTGFLLNLGKGYKIFLNLFIGVLLISVAVFLHSTVQKNNAVAKLPVSKPSSDNQIFASILNGDNIPYVNDLPSFEPRESENIGLIRNNSTDDLTAIPINVTMEADEFEYVKSKKSIVVSGAEPMPIFFEDEVFIQENGLLRERWEQDYSFKQSIWGVKFGYQFMTDVRVNTFASRFTGGLFYRSLITPQTAIQFDLLYNPTVFRPITYVEKWQANSQHITDSALVNNSRYISFPFTVYYESDWFNVNVGGQISRLLGVYGDKILKSRTMAGTEQEKLSYGRVNNMDAFKRNSLALVAEVDLFPLNRLSVGFKFQYSLTDLTKAKLGSNIHRFGAVQFKTAYVLNKAK